MAIAQVRAQINGNWHTLTLNESTGNYEATITAPGATSYNLTGGYYNVKIEATNTAGTVTTADATDLTSLRLVVKETVKPVITVTSPTEGAYTTNNQPIIKFKVTDESGGSGVNLSSVVVKIDGAAVTGYTNTAITNGYEFTLTPSVLLDGAHTISVTAQDNDGNEAVQKSVSFTVDTVPPVLTVTTPVDNLETNTAPLTVSGTTNDATSSPVTVTIKLNGTDQGSITVATDGTFSKSVTLTDGSNTIIVTATDKAGKSSSVTRTVMLDTSVPVIQSASITPNPANINQSVVISVVIA